MFCDQCGGVPERRRPRFYVAPILIGAFSLLVIPILHSLRAVEFDKPQVQQSPAVPVQPDRAAVVISHCGHPTSDKTVGRAALAVRTVTYRKQKTRVVFVADQIVPGIYRWKQEKVLDFKTSRKLGAKEIASRLPCLAAE